jgi:hypothetical protein
MLMIHYFSQFYSLSAIFRIAHCPPFFIHVLNVPQFSYARSLSSISHSMLTVPYFLHTRAQCLLIFVLKLIVRRFRIARCPKIFLLALTVYHFCKLVLTVSHFLKYSKSLSSSLRSTYGTQCAKVLFFIIFKVFFHPRVQFGIIFKPTLLAQAATYSLLDTDFVKAQSHELRMGYKGPYLASE